jgi:nitrogen fixation protein NifB
MKPDMNNHPCFNDKARHTYGRVHLPVAPDCNIQCNFCNRKYDCVNESRPGVTSAVLSPEQALVYLENINGKRDNLSVVGIAGPGDPFAVPEKTMETLRLVRDHFPEKILCVASNGLNIGPYIDELAQLNTSHITITVNAVDPEVGAKVYPWIRYKKRIYRKTEGARLLMEKQLEAIKRLKEKGVTVKVNTIIIPGINDTHIPAVAEKMAELGVDILNCIPLYKNEGSAFAHIDEPDKKLVAKIRKEAAEHIPQMHHCTRCRADAAGLLGEETDKSDLYSLMGYSTINPASGKERTNIAVASREGMLVNLHLGEAEKLMIFQVNDGKTEYLETRETPPRGGGARRWEDLADTIDDCGYLLVNGVGQKPQETLEKKGIQVLTIEGMIEDAISALTNGNNVARFIKRRKFACGEECSGTGGGCG